MEEAEQNVLDKYRIDGIDPALSTKVCLALKHKWQIMNDTDINLTKMAVFYKADRDVLIRIIRWYEGHLIDTRFNVKD
jgi:hypothetical protein